MTHGDGPTPAAWPGLTLFRSGTTLPRQPVTYMPSLCVVLQGQKRVWVGDEALVYDPLNYLVATLGLPLEFEIQKAAPKEPLLALVLELDLAAVGQLLVDLDDDAEAGIPTETHGPALFVSTLDEDLRAALGRLLAAASKPRDLEILGPSINREILYRVLSGEQGRLLRSLMVGDSATHRISRVVRHLAEHCTEHWTIDGIAARWGMSTSTLHHSFRRVTGMSPLQFIKRTRLHKARMMMFERGLGAAEAAFEVGYESPSQFSREFKRLFGMSPSRAAEALQATSGAPP